MSITFYNKKLWNSIDPIIGIIKLSKPKIATISIKVKRIDIQIIFQILKFVDTGINIIIVEIKNDREPKKVFLKKQVYFNM